MPRQKRSLAEADANAAKPAAKRVSTSSTAPGNENVEILKDGYDAMNIMQLQTILKKRDIPYTDERKSAMIQRLREVDRINPNRYNDLQKTDLAKILHARGLKISGGTKAILIDRLKVDDIENPDRPFNPPVHNNIVQDLEFVTMCRPYWDKDQESRDKDDGAEYQEDEENSNNGAEEREDEENTGDDDSDVAERPPNQPGKYCGDGTCTCGKRPEDCPEWKWIISKRALDMVCDLSKELWKRDQDAHDEYIYNDWTGYGFQELVENELLAFEKDMASDNAKALWPHIEALAYFLPGESDPWFMSDDSKGILDTLKMIGGAVMVTLKQMEDQGFLKQDSAIPNIGLVIAMFKALEHTWPGDSGEKELSWTDAALLKIQEAEIELKGAPCGIEKIMEELDGDKGDWDDESIKWDKFNWKGQMAQFKRDHRKGSSIGGTHYCLVKEPKKARGGSKKSGGKGGPLRITLGPGENIEDFI